MKINHTLYFLGCIYCCTIFYGVKKKITKKNIHTNNFGYNKELKKNDWKKTMKIKEIIQ